MQTIINYDQVMIIVSGPEIEEFSEIITRGLNTYENPSTEIVALEVYLRELVTKP